MQTAHILIWAAVGCMVLHILGHMMGVATWKRSSDPTRKVVVDHMVKHKFPFMGALRSLANMYDGFGHAATAAMVFLVLLLGLATFHLTDAAPFVHPFLLLSGLYLFAWAIDEIIFFFPLAAGMSGVSGVLVLIAWYLTR